MDHTGGLVKEWRRNGGSADDRNFDAPLGNEAAPRDLILGIPLGQIGLRSYSIHLEAPNVSAIRCGLQKHCRKGEAHGQHTYKGGMSRTAQTAAGLINSYARWRSSRLGRITAALEHQLLFELIDRVTATLLIGYGLVIPNSPIAEFNPYTNGFAVTVAGFVPPYLAGVRRLFVALGERQLKGSAKLDTRPPRE